jgi:hypothetical protein
MEEVRALVPGGAKVEVEAETEIAPEPVPEPAGIDLKLDPGTSQVEKIAADETRAVEAEEGSSRDDGRPRDTDA